MTTKILKYLKQNKGYSLIETVVYVSILSIISLVGMNTILSFTTSYRDVLALRVVDNGAIDSLERITRDVRSATSVNTLSSTLGTSPGVLSLTTTSNGVSTTTRFYLDSGRLKVDVNGVYSGPLTPAEAQVSSLIFTKMDSDNSSAVKIDMILSGTVGTTTKTKTYHSTIVMKGL